MNISTILKNYVLLYLVVLLFGVSLISCSKKDSTPDVPTSGNLFGTIQTWDHKTTSTDDVAGFTVTITNLAHKSSTKVTALAVSGNVVFGEPRVSFSQTVNPTLTNSSRVFVRYFLNTVADVSPTKYLAASAVVKFSNGSGIRYFLPANWWEWALPRGKRCM